MRSALSFLAALAFLSLAVVPAEAETSRAYRYVAGATVPTLVVLNAELGPTGGFCTKVEYPVDAPAGPTYPGGVCWIPVAPGPVAIQILADEGGAWFDADVKAPYSQVVGDVVTTGTATCAQATGDGALTLVVPDGCPLLNVYLHAPAIAGMLVVAQP